MERAPGRYSASLAAKLVQIKPQTFQAWAKARLVHGWVSTLGKQRETVYSYDDLLLMVVVKRLKDAGATVKAIRTALNTIWRITNGEPGAWKRLAILVDSGLIVVIDPTLPHWNPIAASRGPQKIATVFMPELLDEVQRSLVPPERFPEVEIAPDVLGGAPVIKGTRHSTRAVASTASAGVDPLTAYPDLTVEQVRNAQEYEEFLAAA